jgi:HNH endonuclease
MYTCWCGEEKCKYVSDALKGTCKECTSKMLKETPKDTSKCPTDIKDEKWKPVKGGFISSLGRACNVFGKILTPDNDFCYFLGGKSQYASILIANAFEIDGFERLNGPKCEYIVRVSDRTKLPTLKDIWIGTRAEVGQINGKKSRKSENFKQTQELNIDYYLKNIRHVIIDELPDYIIFEDGNIYNSIDKTGGKRFLTFSLTSSNGKSYKKICTETKVYAVHRLVCMAFYPKEGKTKYDDYNHLEVNHVNGNTLDNSKSNLEWNDHSQNMNHAYQTKLNKKVQGVIQYNKCKNGSLGEEIRRFVSIAEACRQTKVSEHEIREVCKGVATGISGYLWRFQDENKARLYSQKFSSKNSASSSILKDHN